MMTNLNTTGNSSGFNNGRPQWLRLGMVTLLTTLLTTIGLSFWFSLQIRQGAEQQLTTLLSMIEYPAATAITSGKTDKFQNFDTQLSTVSGLLAMAVYDANGKYLGGDLYSDSVPKPLSVLPTDISSLISSNTSSAFYSLLQVVNHWDHTTKPYRSAGFSQLFLYANDNHIDIYSPMVIDNQFVGILYLAVSTPATPGFLGVFFPTLGVLAIFSILIMLGSYQIAEQKFLASADALTVKLKIAYAKKIAFPILQKSGFSAVLTLFNQLIEDINDKNRLLNFQPPILNSARQQNLNQFEDLSRQNRQLQVLSSQALAAQHKAETANQIKSEFIAAMGHKIRTPMSAILGILDTLWQDNLNDDQRHSIKTMQQSSTLLLNLLNDMTDFSKIESGELALCATEFNCAKLIQKNFQLLELDAKAKGLKYSLVIATELPYMLIGDASRLSQILVNLLSNAIKYTAQGEVRLTVSTEKTEPKKMRLHCEVTDTGIGISALQLDALFDVLSREETVMTRAFPGSGLGLDITKKLVRLMHGKIGVHSQPGIGSTFWFWIDFDIGKSRITSVKVQNNFRFNASLLVAEDYPANQLVVQRFLEDLGCQVNLVNNGFEAVKAIKKQAYDLIFMDCQMPFIDGYQAAQEIRKIELMDNSGRRVPIIALTAHALNEDEIKCKNAGMDEWVTKPFTRHDLSKILLKWLPKELVVNNQPILKTDALTLAKASSVMEETHAINMKFFTRQFKLDNIDDIAFLNALAKAFQENAAKTLSSLQISIDNADNDAIRKHAHGLKSLSINVGSGRLAELCAIMEKSGKNHELDHMQEVLDSMKQEYLRVLSELASLCTKA